MKQTSWLILGLALAAVASGPPAAAREKVPTLGVGPAYDAIGKVPVLHDGRRKPLDTMAREEVKQIFGKETVTLDGPDEKDEARKKVVAKWGPVGALLDWSVRPEFWDDQPVILCEYLPLKRLILADTVRTQLLALAAKDSTSGADRKALAALAADPNVSARALGRFAARSGLAKEDRKAVLDLADALGEEHRWLSPNELENAQVTVDGQKLPFDAWFGQCVQKNRKAENDATGTLKLTDVEKRGLEVGIRLIHYKAIRDRKVPSVEQLLISPRPSNAQGLAFLTQSLDKIRKDHQGANLSLLEEDALRVLQTYWEDIPVDQRKDPGTDAKLDKKLSDWLRDNAAWVPLRVLLDTPPEQLEAAGFPAEKVEAFRTSFRALEQAEEDAPGRVPEAQASRFLAAARDLGQALNPVTYPTPKEMEREAYFNAFAPFYKAPFAYGLALAAFVVCLGITARKGTALGNVRLGLYGVGLLAFVAGIALEVVGFYYRVRIGGWGLVTNMYETVIWVALVTAVVGLVLEGVYRQTYTVLAASGVALLATILAANVPLLDADIKGIPPVLRDKFWLATHVTMEVGSYGAFALAWGLGLIGVVYYLTATYRRSPRLAELGAPLLPGLPMFAVGAFGLLASFGYLGPEWEVGPALFVVSNVLAGLGGFLTIVGLGALAGEGVARLTFRDDEALNALADELGVAPAATAVQTVTVAEGSAAVATLSKPSVAEIRARAAATRPKLDARGRAMQATAAQIKPLANFIYRTMQVGVLLIAAGTFLGGWWAARSWGRFWGWDPKEVWALITLLVYLIPLHGRFAGWVNTFGLVMSSVVCFLSVLMAWYGVNFVLGVGLHSYGFVEGGSQGGVGAVTLAVLAFAGAAFWRRWLASRHPSPAAA